MRAIAAGSALTFCVGMASAQTFVPRFDRSVMARNGESSVFGSKNDLETSIGRVAEAPKLMPAGASASMPPDDEPSSMASTVTASVVAEWAFAVAVLAAGAVSWRRARRHG